MSDSDISAKLKLRELLPAGLKREREDYEERIISKSQKHNEATTDNSNRSEVGAASDSAAKSSLTEVDVKNEDVQTFKENETDITHDINRGAETTNDERTNQNEAGTGRDIGQNGEGGEDAEDVDTGEDVGGEDGEQESEEEEEDENEDEDDENDLVDSSRKSKRRRANQFLDIEAEVDDEEEDELDEDDEEAELLREQFISDDQNERETNITDYEDDRLHRQYDRRRQEAEDQDAEVLAEKLKQRYRKTHTVYRGDTAATGIVSQKLLMPSINDPAIFAIRCTPGREKELVRKLFEKKRTLARLGRPLEVLSIFQRDAFKGYIYIEAKKPEAIQQALTGMVNIYANQRIIVPVSEYPDLLKQVKSTDVEIVPGIYVRISRGKYKSDLAIVDNLSENGLEVRCKLVPRLDYGKNDETTSEGKKIRLKIRPVPNLFNELEARSFDAEGLQSGRGLRSYIYRGEEYQDGFLYKDFKLQFIQTKDVHPRLEELDLFQSGSKNEGMDLANVAANLKNSRSHESGQGSSFQPGDNAEIRRGEQAKTVGKVVGASLNEVTIVVTSADDSQLINQEITVTIGDLRKVFALGDHVKVIAGKHTDQTGLVIKLEGDSVVFLSDQTSEDVRVFANYLMKATDSSTSADMVNSMYEIKDLVQLNASTFGVIVKAETGIYGVLASDDRIINVKPSGISSKLRLTRREQIATDSNGLTIKVGDSVKEKGGDKKKEGTILHIYKNTLFVESRELTENLGIFVTNALSVCTVSTKDLMISKTLGPDLSRMKPNLKLAPIAAQASKMRVGGRDKLLNKDVIINSGNHKGLMGKVIETDDVDARIELHTKSKKIKINKTKLSVLIRGESIPYLRFIGASDQGGRGFPALGPAFSSGGNSVLGGATPAVGGGAATSWQGKTASISAGGNSSWGSVGNSSAWGAGGGASTWGAGGGNSTWGSSNNAAPGSSWESGKPGGNSAWGKSGVSSSWVRSGRASVWGDGKNSAWGRDNDGGSSAWGSNPGNGSDSSWGNQGGNTSGWDNNGGENRSAWGPGASGGSNSSWGQK